MKPSAAYLVLAEARAAGCTLRANGGVLRYRGPNEAVAKILPDLKAHKPAILGLLAAMPSLGGTSP